MTQQLSQSDQTNIYKVSAYIAAMRADTVGEISEYNVSYFVPDHCPSCGCRIGHIQGAAERDAFENVTSVADTIRHRFPNMALCCVRFFHAPLQGNLTNRDGAAVYSLQSSHGMMAPPPARVGAIEFSDGVESLGGIGDFNSILESLLLKS